MSVSEPREVLDRAVTRIDNFGASCLACTATLFSEYAPSDGAYVKEIVNERALDFGWPPIKGGGFYCRAGFHPVACRTPRNCMTP